MDSINILVIQVLFALTSGGTVVCAQYIGAKDSKRAGCTTAQLIFLTLIGTGIITLIFLIGRNSILKLIFGKVDIIQVLLLFVLSEILVYLCLFLYS